MFFYIINHFHWHINLSTFSTVFWIQQVVLFCQLYSCDLNFELFLWFALSTPHYIFDMNCYCCITFIKEQVVSWTACTAINVVNGWNPSLSILTLVDWPIKHCFNFFIWDGFTKLVRVFRWLYKKPAEIIRNFILWARLVIDSEVTFIQFIDP